MQQPFMFQCTASYELLQARTKRLKTEKPNWTNFHLGLILVYYFSLSVRVCIAAIMANVLRQNTDSLQLSSQDLALVLAQQAATGVATSRRSEAFRTLVSEVQTSKEEANRYREKSKYLELDVARTDAYLARTRQLLAQEQSRASQLEQELNRVWKQQGSASQKGHFIASTENQPAAGSKVSFGTTSFVKETDKLKTGQVLQQERKSSSELTDKPKGKTADSIQPVNQGVSYEEHEIIIQQAMTLKGELTKLAKQKGQDVDKILEAAEYREQLKRLQQDIQDKADENDKLLQRIYLLSRRDNGAASQVVELQFKNEKLEKRLRVSQVMIDTLSKRYEELKDEMEMSSLHQSRAEKEDAPEAMDTADTSKSNESNTRQDDSTRPDGEDLSDGTLDQQKQSYETRIQYLDSQLKQTMMENTQLYRERQEAERQRLIYEQRYNKLMETLQDVQQKSQQCSNCHSLQHELDKLRREFSDLKDMNELVRAQMKLYEEELRQEQQESASLKIKNNFHIEQWKKNCQRMGQQVDLLTGDLNRERDENRRLKQLLKKSPTSRNFSLAPIFSTPARCTPAAPKSTPWQVGYRDEIETDGPSGQDHYDGIENTLTPGGADASSSNASQSMLASHLMTVKPLECPRCKREYPPDRMTDFEQHVDKCIDSS